MVKLGFNTLLDLYSFPRPIVAAISGHAVALGIFVACCCDYRIGIEGKFICQANEVRNNMDIPIQMMEIVKARVNKRFFYRAVLHGDPLSMQESLEAGYIDGDGDGYLGDSPTSQDSLGLVVNSGGYLIPGDFDSNGTYDFLEEGSQVAFDIHPSELEIYSEGDDIVLTTESNSLSTIFYQWQISSDGGISWNNVVDNNIFSGAQTNTLSMYGLTKEFDQHLLQLVVSTPGYVCGSDEISEPTLLQLETVLIPEGFSPNGDNVNDTWHISGIDQYPINHVEVYSRWETKVFETDNYGTNNEWNGIPNVLNGLILGNSNVPEGTYFYIITFGGEHEGKKPIKGFVYLRNKLL
mgnify:CR=1 FL=1